MTIKTDRDKLTAAFDHMVENVGQSIHDAEEALAPTIDEMIQNAQAIAEDIHNLSKDEAAFLSEALRRDIVKANEALNQQKKDIKDWFGFDLILIGDKFLELVARAADKNWLEFRDFESVNIAADTYKTGEVCNAGTLCCKSCDQTINFSKTSHIPPCPRCHHSEFYRVIG
jgi:hypothetical protein